MENDKFGNCTMVMETKRRNEIRKALLNLAKEQFRQEQFSSTTDNRERVNHKSSSGSTTSTGTSSCCLAPISPTPYPIIHTILPRLGLNENSIVLDLGCGDGRWIITASQLYKCQSIGCDLDSQRLDLAKKQIQEKYPELKSLIQLKQVDVMEFIASSSSCSILQDVHVLIVYLFREAMQSLCHVLQSQSIYNITSTNNKTFKYNDNDQNKMLKIVCVGFTLPNWIPIHQETIGAIHAYIYLAMKESSPNTK